MKTTFAEYMEETLYGIDGYYSSGRARSGKNGDYFTAPDVGPALGRMLAAIFADWQRRLNLSPFHLVECGAGEGTLAESIIQTLQETVATPSCKFPYTAIERSAARRQKLAALADATGLPMAVTDSLDSLAEKPACGCLFANELLDAFPVHRVRRHQGQLQEAYVEASRDCCHPEEHSDEGSDTRRSDACRVASRLGLNSQRGEILRYAQNDTGYKKNYHLAWGPPSTPRLQAYLDRINIRLPEGYETEINLAMADWFRSAGAALSKGLALIIDYGRPAHEYYAPERNAGTLRAFRRHRVSGNVLDSGGDCDLTADVDFTSAALDAQEAGFVPLAFMELGSFLMQGLINRHPRESGPSTRPAGPSARFVEDGGPETLMGLDSPLTTAGNDDGREALTAHCSSLQYLIHPEGMGSAFQVLILGKGIPWSPSNFEHNRLNRLGIPSPPHGRERGG